MFKRIETIIRQDKQVKKDKKWFKRKQYDIKQKINIRESIQRYQKERIAKQRDIEQTFSQKCVLGRSVPKASEFQQTIELLGTSDMCPPNQRQIGKKILLNGLGIIKP